MGESYLNTIIKEAIKGNELPFNIFFENTFLKLKPSLQKITNCEDDTKEIYVTSMQKFWERFIINKEELPKNSTGYIYQMCKNAFLLKKRNNWSSVVLSDNIEKHSSNNLVDPLRIDTKEELLKFKALTTALETLCPKCKTLIENEFDKKIKLKDLMSELGYSNYQALIQAKYNCKKRLAKKVQEVLSNLKTEKLTIK